MSNEMKEKISIMLNIVSIPHIGTDLKEYCESQMVTLLKGITEVQTRLDLTQEG